MKAMGSDTPSAVSHNEDFDEEAPCFLGEGFREPFKGLGFWGFRGLGF